MDLDSIIHSIVVWFIPAVLAITLHEAAHALVARWLGDDTASRLGRVTLNPIRHIDPIGTILLPGMMILAGSPFLFGYAKPVPVNFGRLGQPKRDMILVAAAGPGINLALALIFAFAFHIVPLVPGEAAFWLRDFLQNAILVNIVLAVFNMFPIPPLDGGRILTGLLPMPLAIRFARLERFGMVLLLTLVFFIPLIASQFGTSLNIVGTILMPPVIGLFDLITAMAGLRGG